MEYLKEILVRLVKAKTVKGVMDQLDAKVLSNNSNNTSLRTNESQAITAEGVRVNTKSTTKRKEKQCNIDLKATKTQIEIEEYRGYKIYEFENTFSRGQSHQQLWILQLMIFLQEDVLYDVSITGLREVINSKEI